MKIIQLFKDFLQYRKLLNWLDIARMDEKLKAKIKLTDDGYEKEINDVLLYNLARKMIDDDIPYDFASWFKTALLLRVSLKKGVGGIDK